MMRLAVLPLRAMTRAATPMMTKRGFAAAAAATAARVTRVDELPGGQAVRVTFQDGASARFHKLWLRDHCRCPQCLHPETKQRQLDTASIPFDTPVHSVGVNDKGSIAISWTSDVVRRHQSAGVFVVLSS